MLAGVCLFEAVCQRIHFNTTKGTGLMDFVMLQAIARLGKEMKAVTLLEGPKGIRLSHMTIGILCKSVS